MTVDLAKARALVEPLLGASYALPSDARGWFDHPTAGHVPHNVCTDAADTIDALLDEVEHWKSEAASWEKQASDRVDDALKFAAERDALIAKVERLNSPVVQSEWQKLVDERERLIAENRSIRTLMDMYNLGGWTDSLRLIQERDALALDAARYRWLRRDVPYDECAAVYDKHSEDELDAAIDAAMGASDE